MQPQDEGVLMMEALRSLARVVQMPRRGFFQACWLKMFEFIFMLLLALRAYMSSGRDFGSSTWDIMIYEKVT